MEHSQRMGQDWVTPSSDQPRGDGAQQMGSPSAAAESLGCPPLPCLPASKLTEWMCREPGAAGWPGRGAG